jgi:hypothetical protein
MKANYQSGGVTSNNLKLWNDFTVKHEISLCQECLLGNPKYQMRGLLETYRDRDKDPLVVWLKRMSNAINEAKERFKDDIEYMKEIDDLKFLIDYELV